MIGSETKTGIEGFTRRLLDRNGLIRWDVEWCNSRKMLGQARPGDKKIRLSKYWFLNVGEERVREVIESTEGTDALPNTLEDTIRHEIAHAIQFDREGRSGHGRTWKKICVEETGADPTRTAKIPYMLLKMSAKYRTVCGECGFENLYWGKPRKIGSCPECCDHYNPDFKMKLEAL